MSAHDWLCSEVRRLIALLDEYGEEHSPQNFETARERLKAAQLVIEGFPDEEELPL